MKYKPLAIANYFIDRAHLAGEHLDQLKLQKLVYLAHGWSLAIFDEPLLDEQVQAWKFGPVFDSLWRKFTVYGRGPIRENGVEVVRGQISVPNVPPEDDRTRQLLEKVWEIYGEYSGVQLSKMTHEPGTPWDQTYSNGRKRDIPNALIRRHFLDFAQRDEASD